MINYVKFLRGTPNAFNSLKEKDNNTLYFISEQGADIGYLYLGAKQIVCTADKNITNVGDLTDILLNEETLADGDILAYDWEQQKWVNKTLGEVVTEVMVGASDKTNGKQGLVPAPSAGQQDLFLRGDGTWAAVELSEEQLAELTSLKNNFATLVGDYVGEDGLVTKSIKEIALDTLVGALIPENAKESLDTLQEIAAWIQDHPEDISAVNADIAELKTQVGNLDSVINGSTNESGESIPGLVGVVAGLETTVTELDTAIGELEAAINGDDGLSGTVAELSDVLYGTTNELGEKQPGLIDKVDSLLASSGEGDPSLYVLQSVYSSEVGDLTQLENRVSENSTLVDEINSINERIAWQELEEA